MVTIKEQTKFNWDKAPIICKLNETKWILGPEADGELNWEDAKAWCKLVGGELPPREILLQAYLNESIRPMFEDGWCWSSTEFEFGSTTAWIQGFSHGPQSNWRKDDNFSVRAVKKLT